MMEYPSSRMTGNSHGNRLKLDSYLFSVSVYAIDLYAPRPQVSAKPSKPTVQYVKKVRRLRQIVEVCYNRDKRFPLRKSFRQPWR